RTCGGGKTDGPSEALLTFGAALAIALVLAHLRGRTFLVLVDGDREPADHVLVDAVLPLELGNHVARTLEVEQHEVRLAVPVDLVGEALEAPGFGLRDLAAALFDDFGGTGGERIDLSLAQILARQKDMLVKRHARVPFTSCRSLADPPE